MLLMFSFLLLFFIYFFYSLCTVVDIMFVLKHCIYEYEYYRCVKDKFVQLRALGMYSGTCLKPNSEKTRILYKPNF